jgi:membrane fusion protein, multidrug efflux system
MNRKFLRQIMGRLAASLVVLAIGVGGMQALARMRAIPAQRPAIERTLRVEAITVQPETVQVMLQGFGQVRALNVVEVAPEIAGQVVAVHPRLDVGEIIAAGEVLFEVDARDYAARQTEAQAQVEQLGRTIERLEMQYANDRERLKTLERSRQLANDEFERLKALFEQDDVGTRSGVDAAERAYHAAADHAEQLAQAVALYPLRIQETRDALTSAQAGLEMRALGVDRTQVRAPFTARVKRVGVEAGQYVTPGPAVLTLANDAILEISVPLDSRQAREGLRFKPGANATQEAWFNELEPVECMITWTESVHAVSDATPGHSWRGRLHRVEQYDERTRTVTVAVRVDGADAVPQTPDGLPLVDGMFCSVTIPGRSVESVYRLPRQAVSFTGDVFVAVGNGRGALGFDRTAIQNPRALSGAIIEGADPLSRYLRGHMQAGIESALTAIENEQRQALEQAIALLKKSNGDGLRGQRAVVDQVHAQLGAYLDAHSPEERLTQVLVEELNRVVQSGALYDQARFEAVALPGELRARLEQPATPEERIRLNRRLLEAAYPEALGPSFRLQTRRVEVVRQQGEYTLVRGLEPGEHVITTRLVNPLENSLLDVVFPEPPALTEVARR